MPRRRDRPTPAEIRRRKRIARAMRARGSALTDEGRRKIVEANLGNRNAVGHRVSPKSLKNLKGSRKGRLVSPASIANLAQFRKKKEDRRADPE